jgi:hypothetical protein
LVCPLLQVFGLSMQAVNAPVPFLPAFAALFALLLPPLLEQAVSPSAMAATPASNAFPLWTLTCE